MSDIQDKLIRYYADVSDRSIVNLKNEKGFQFKRYLVNHSLLKVVETSYEKITDSDEAKKMIKDYINRMEGMTKLAKTDYSRYLKRIKATHDPVTKQRIIEEYADKGVTGFVAKNGARWNIETYSNMVTTHFNNELVRLSILENIPKRGKVRVSKHDGACPLCTPYEGRVLTLKQLSKARDNGLFHVRCKHIITEV